MNNDEMNNGVKKNSNKKNMGFADRFITAMFLPGEYPSLIKLTSVKIVTYVAFLVLLLSLIQYVIPVMAAVAGYGGVRSFIIDELPDFSLQNGEFSLSDKYEKNDEDAGIYILVDTDVEKFTAEDVDRDLLQVMLVSRSNIIMYNNLTGINGIVQEQKFSEFKDVVINNQSIAGLAPVIYIGMFGMFVFMYLFTLVRYLLSAFCYALILYILTKITAANTTFGVIYKIAVFAQTFGSIVSALANFIGTPVFVMAGSMFAMIVTVLIMNRAYFKIVPPPKAR